MRALCVFLALAGCDAGHLGNPLTLPVRGVVAGVQNAGYDARRAQVKARLEAHGAAVRSEVAGQGGSHLAALLEGVPARDHAKVRHEIAALPVTPDWAEQATVIVMVHRD